MVQWKLWQCFRGIQLNEQPSGLGSLRAWQWHLVAACAGLAVTPRHCPIEAAGAGGLVHHRLLSPQCRSAK